MKKVNLSACSVSLPQCEEKYIIPVMSAFGNLAIFVLYFYRHLRKSIPKEIVIVLQLQFIQTTEV